MMITCLQRVTTTLGRGDERDVTGKKTTTKKMRKIMNTQTTHRELHSRLSHSDGRNPLAPPPFRLIAHTPVPLSVALGSYLRCALSTVGWATPNVSGPPHPKFREKGRGIGSMRRLSGGGGCKMSTIASRQKGQGMRSRE